MVIMKELKRRHWRKSSPTRLENCPDEVTAHRAIPSECRCKNPIDMVAYAHLQGSRIFAPKSL